MGKILRTKSLPNIKAKSFTKSSSSKSAKSLPNIKTNFLSNTKTKSTPPPPPPPSSPPPPPPPKSVLDYSYFIIPFNEYFNNKYPINSFNYLHYNQSNDLNRLNQDNINYFIDFFKMYHSHYYINHDYDLNYDEHFDFLENIKKNLYDKQTFHNFNNTYYAKNNFRRHILNYIKDEFEELHKEYIDHLIISYNNLRKNLNTDFERHNSFIEYFQKIHLKLFLFEISHDTFNNNFIKHMKIINLLFQNEIDISLLHNLTYYKPYNFMNKIFQLFYVKYTNKDITIDKFYKSINSFYEILFSKKLSKKYILNKFGMSRAILKKLGQASDTFIKHLTLFGGKKNIKSKKILNHKNIKSKNK